ncbi:MAG TPA: hypothetical protein VMT53_01790 [Terriglobales bacterium]|nr:hypothetical protein [Terriglobales bacterium]
MNAAKTKGAIIVIGVLLAASSAVLAQTQNQSIWQKIKNSAKQTGQNTAQQGAQQVQQGAQQVQQGVQQGIGGVGNQMNGGQPSPCGSLGGAASAGGGTLTNAAFNGGGGNGNFTTGSCGQNCFNAGPFAAAVSQMTMSQQGGYHIIRMQVQFHNATNQPLAIAYHDGSMVMVDDQGNTYQGAGGNPGEVQGMGIDRGNQTDSQFVLGPGQTGSALFSVARYRPNTSAIGNAFTYNFTIDELQAQNGAQAIVARQYNLNFPNLTAGSSGGAFPATTPASGFLGGTASPSAATGVATSNPAAIVPGGKGAAIASRPAAVPTQRKAVNARSAVATTAPPRAPVSVPGAVNNAALRSAAVAKPAAAVKAAPATPAVKKTADNTSK